MEKQKRSAFIVIEGTDGSGKTEQTDRLIARLQGEGVSVQGVDFPQYGKPSAYFIERYLNGAFGPADAVTPREASIFYGLDRFDVGMQIRKHLESGEILISNRYVASNLGHQGAKIGDKKEREEFFYWDYELEYGIFGIPRPDINIFLHVPARIAASLAAAREKKGYLEHGKVDIHEANLDYLVRAEESYLHAIRTFPDDFVVIECMEGERLLSIEEIHQKIWNVIKEHVGL